MEKEYLGDGVYVEVDDGMLKLTTMRSHRMTGIDVIFLEPSVMDALTAYYQRAKSFYENKKTKETT